MTRAADPTRRIVELVDRSVELHALGRAGDALPVVHHALALAEAQLGEDDPTTARCLQQAAVLLEQQGDRARAWGYHERVLGIAERLLGADHPLAIACLVHLERLLHDLAGDYRAGGDLVSTRGCLERALAIADRLRDPDADTVRCLVNLGTVLRDQRELAGARRLFDRAVVEARAVSDRPGAARARVGLAYVMLDRSRFQVARRHFEAALALFRDELGDRDPETVETARAIAALDELVAAFAGDMGALERFARDRRRYVTDA